VGADRAIPEQTGVFNRQRGDSRIREQAAAGKTKLQDLGVTPPSAFRRSMAGQALLYPFPN